MRWILALFLSLALHPAGPARAEETIPVAIELVLALDSSASVDRREFQLQLDGLALAFRDPEVLRQIETLRPLGSAIAVIQWGGPGETRIVIPFTHVETARDAKALGFRIGLIRRWMRASSTSIATGLADAQALLEGNGFDGHRRIIDVSGDGSDNSGVDIDQARARIAAAGITVNGLPILADDPTLADYYQKQVIVGPTSFIEPARDFEDYVRAIKEKLLRELRPLES